MNQRLSYNRNCRELDILLYRNVLLVMLLFQSNWQLKLDDFSLIEESENTISI